MERLAARLGFYLATQLNLDNDRQEQISFGTFVLLQSTLVLSCLVIITLLIGTIGEALIIAGVAASLRAVSGGAHLRGPLQCTLISVSTFVGGSIIAKQTTQVLYLYPHMLQISIIALLSLVACLMYLVYAPVAAKNRQLSIERRSKLRRISIRLAAIYTATAILCTMTGCVWAPAIIVGMWFQGFTLTPAGDWLARNLDSLVIAYWKRR